MENQEPATSNEFVATIAGADCEQSFQRTKPLAMALSVNELVAINVDMPATLLTAIAALPRIAPFMEVAKSLPNYDYSQFHSLREFTLALHSVQAKHTHAQTPPPELPIMLAEATRRRDIILADCGALIARGYMNAASVSEYKGLGGYKNVAFDLTGLVELMTETWPKIEGKVLFTREELEDNRLFALKFVESVAYRDKNASKVTELGDLRQRIFTLFFRAYDQVRRAIIFLRWDMEDADSIVPSLYAGRGGNSRRLSSEDEKSAVTNAVPAKEGEAVKAEANSLPAGHPESSAFSAA